jgi:hypothetical protein
MTDNELRDRLAASQSARKQDARCRLALRQLRRMVMSIQGGDASEEIVETIKASLQTAQVDYAGYGVNFIDERPSGIHITQHPREPDGGVFHRVLQTPDIVTTWWQQGRTVYRKDLLSQDPYEELAQLDTEDPGLRRSIIDVPFSGGTLGVNSQRANAFSDEDCEFFQDLAQVLSTATQRWHDLGQLEERNALLARQVTEGHRRAQELDQANEALAEKDRLLKAFQETGKTLLGSLDLENILDTLALQVIQTGIFRGIMVALVDGESRTVQVSRSFMRKRDEKGEWQPVEPSTNVVGVEYDLDDENVTAQVARTGQMAVIGG